MVEKTMAELRARQLEAVREVVLAITSETDRDVLLTRIIHSTVTLLEARKGGIKVYDPQQDCLVALTNIGHPESTVGRHYTRKAGMAGYLWNSLEDFIIIPDYRKWPERIPDFARPGWLESVLGVKLKWQKQMIGVLYVEDQVGHRFDEQDAELLQLLADHVAIALISNEYVARQTQLLALAPFGVIANNKKGQIIEANDAAAKMLNYPHRDSLIGKNVIDVYASEEKAREIGRLIRVNDGPYCVETDLKDSCGDPVPVRLTVMSATGLVGRHLEYIGYFEDRREIRKTSDHLNLLLSARKKLVDENDLDQALQKLTEEITHRLNVSLCRIFLLDESSQSLQLRACYLRGEKSQANWERWLNQKTAIDEWEGLYSVLFRERLSHLIVPENDAKREILRRWSEQHRLNPGIQSMLVVPIRTREKKVIGLLDISELSPQTVTPITEEKANLAETIVDQISSLIELRLNERRWAAALTTSHELVSTDISGDFLDRFADLVQSLAGASGVRIILVEMNSGRARAYDLAVTGDDSLNVENAVRRRKGLTARIMTTGESVVIADTKTTALKFNKSWKERGIRAAIGLPFSLEGKRIGVMWIYYKTPHPFSEAEVKVYTLIANQAATAYEIWRLRRFQNVAGEMAQVATLADEELTKKAIVQKVIEVMGSDVVSLHVWNRDVGWDYRSTIQGNRLPVPPPPLTGPVSIVLEAIVQGSQIWQVDDVTKDLVFKHSRFTREEEIRSSAVVKLQIREELVGALIISFRHRHEFTLGERQALLFFADQAAVALQNARLYENFQKGAQSVTNSLDTKEILDSLAKEAAALLNRTPLASRVSYASIFLVDEEREEAYPISTWPKKDIAITRVKTGNSMNYNEGVDGKIGIIGQAIKERRSINVPNVHENPNYIESHERTRSALVVYFALEKFEGQKSITINVESEQEKAFGEFDEKRLLGLADYADIALYNADQKDNIGPYRPIVFMKLIAEMYYHTLAGYLSRLGSAFEQLFKQLNSSRSDPREAAANLERQRSLVNDMKEVLEMPSTALEDISINHFIKERLESHWRKTNFQRQLEGKEPIQLDIKAIKFGIDQEFTAKASKVVLRHILDWLIDNAQEAMQKVDRPCHKFTVTTALEDENKGVSLGFVLGTLPRPAAQLKITLVDTGHGFPPDIIEHQGKKKADLEQKRGRGLPLTHSLLKAFGGTLQLEDHTPHGAEVVLYLPLYRKGEENEDNSLRG